MTVDIALVLLILVAALFLFLRGRLRVDMVALLVLGAVAILGLVTPEEALSGFSNPAVVTVWAVFILSAGLSRTGVANFVGRQVMRLAGTGELRLLLVIMLAAGLMSALMNNVGVAALLLPVVMDIARRTGRAPSRLLMPLAYGALLGGLTTLIGTPPNILASAALEEAGLPAFSMFDFTPVGGAVLITGVLFMVVVGRHLLPHHAPLRALDSSASWSNVYRLDQRLFVIHLPQQTTLAGRSLADSRIGTALGLNVLGIIRNGQTQLAPGPAVPLQGGDRLLVSGRPDRLEELHNGHYLQFEEEAFSIDDLTSSEVRLAEVTLSEEAGPVGHTLQQSGFRRRYGVNVLAVHQGQDIRRTDLQNLELGAGDCLLVQGTQSQLEVLAAEPGLTVDMAPQGVGLYQLGDYLVALRIPAGSPLAGQTLQESRLGDAFDLSVLGIVRDGTTQLMPGPEALLTPGDTLIVAGRMEELATLEALQHLEIAGEAAPELERLQSTAVGMVEAVLSPHTTLVGKTLEELHFREKYNLTVVAIWRAGTAYRSNLREMELRFGDALLLYGPRQRLRLLADDPDFLLLEADLQEPLRVEKGPLAALIMLGVVVSVVVGWLPIAVAAVAGGTLMVLAGCLTMEEAYRHIQWQAVFLIAGMIPLGIAMENSGAATLIAEGVATTAGGWGPLGVLAALFLLTTVSSQVMPNAVVTVLLVPIAITTAYDLGVAPQPLVMAVAISASASFLSPVGHPANVLIMGPGGYRFSDYLRVGAPLVLVVFVTALLLIPVFWPF
ncbi:MAG: SLC13 family permease [Anaerolineae bacterium]|nr:SLC13 family permease [Anaerolineae bacterium]